MVKNEMFRIIFEMLLVVHYEKATLCVFDIELVLWPNLSGQAIQVVLQPCRRVILPIP